MHCLWPLHTYNPIFDYDVDGLVQFNTDDTILDLAPDPSLVQAAKECPTKAIVVKEY